MKTIVLHLQNCSAGSGLWIDSGYLPQGREKWSFPPCKREAGDARPSGCSILFGFPVCKEAGRTRRALDDWLTALLGQSKSLLNIHNLEIPPQK